MQKMVAGNWKMNLGPAEGRAFVEALELPEGDGAPRVIVFPPALTFAAVREALVRTGASAVELGVQNVHPADAGAFTGELSAPMAREAGARYVLVGHSERRHLFGESDEETREKTAAVLRQELVPVLCVGETLDERRADRLEDVLLRQLDAVLGADPVRGAVGGGAPFVLAYEPVWAIGTGETATPADASAAHQVLRERLLALVGPDADARIPILYGGSVKPDNARELMEAPHVDGVLVGGASLDPGSFAAIAGAAS